MQIGVNIFGSHGAVWHRPGTPGYAHPHPQKFNMFMKRLNRVGKALKLDDVISLRVLESKINVHDVAFKQEISEKVEELLEKVKAKKAADVFAKRKSLMLELKLLTKTKKKTFEQIAKIKFIREELQKLDV